MESSTPTSPSPWGDFGLRLSSDGGSPYVGSYVGSPYSGAYEGELRLSQYGFDTSEMPPESNDQNQQLQYNSHNQYSQYLPGWPETTPYVSTPPRTPIQNIKTENQQNNNYPQQPNIVRVKEEPNHVLRASPDCSYGNENTPNASSPVVNVKEERASLVKTEYYSAPPAPMCGGVDTDIAVELYKGPWSDFFGATDRCSWQSSCIQGEKVRWSHQRTFQTGILLRRISTGHYLRPTQLTQVIVNQRVVEGPNAVSHASISPAEELRFQVHFKEGEVHSFVAFTLSFESQAKQEAKGLLSFGAPLPREWYKNHASISHLPYFCFPSKRNFVSLDKYLKQQTPHPPPQQQVSCCSTPPPAQPPTMYDVHQGIYFTLQFGIEKALSKEHSFRLVVSQPSSPQQTPDQIRLHLLSRLAKPATVESLRAQRKEQMGDYLEDCLGGGAGPSTPNNMMGGGLVEVKREKGGEGGRRRKWLDVDRPEQRDLRKSERALKKFYSKMKEQYPEQFPEVERAIKVLGEEMKKGGVGGKMMSGDVLRHAMLVMALSNNS